MARLKKAPSIQLRVSRETAALLDGEIRKQWRLKQAARILGGEKDTPSEIPPAELADSRRERLERLIETEAGVEGRSSLRIRLPELAGSKREIEEALEWAKREEKRLADEAPPAVRLALESEQFLRLYAAGLVAREKDAD